MKSTVGIAALVLGFLATPAWAERSTPPRADGTLSLPANEGVQRVLFEFRQPLGVGAALVRQVRLEAGRTLEIVVGLAAPATLFPDARVRVSWTLLNAAGDHKRPGSDPARIFWSKLLHALDTDVFLVFRAPQSGVYQLEVRPETAPVDLFSKSRWRESGLAVSSRPIPQEVAWAASARVPVVARLTAVDLVAGGADGFVVEVEPNETAAEAQQIQLPNADEGDRYLQIFGTADDIEYFDNGDVGSSGDDWFRLDYSGSQPKLLTACLSIVDQQVAARVRCYRVSPEGSEETNDEGKAAEQSKDASLLLGSVQLVEYFAGKNENEAAHQQTETHRTAINRRLEPGSTLFLRVEANAPAYELEVGVVKPAPFQDAQRAIERGLYDHIGQVDAWLTNRPRGASVERRIRDSGNLLGTNCMSCHTQSGVWGPAIPFALGYRPRNVQLFRHLVNTCYQSMRPTNELKDAANNTSLRPLDLGDGPAGTRVTGHAVVAVERAFGARKLHSMQAIRAANFVLQSGDPGGINAAGPGANVGQGVVFNYAGEIVWSAWRATGEPRYYHALEDKVRKVLQMTPKYSDDLAHRVELLERYFPDNSVEVAQQVAEREELKEAERVEVAVVAGRLAESVEAQVAADIARLRAIQLEGGGWSFDPGALKETATQEAGAEQTEGWTVSNRKPDPAPTALALIAFHAAGVPKEDATVARGIGALLAMQHPSGYWKVESKTGFVGTSYALHALARYHPAELTTETATETTVPSTVAADESLLQTLRRVRDLSVAPGADSLAALLRAAEHSSPLVRYWAFVGLGALHTVEAVPALVTGLGELAKPVREAAHWALRQTLIDDHGWDLVFRTLRHGSARAREAAMRALVMKVDAVLPATALEFESLVAAFDYGMNDDPHPAVRAWALKAAWQWWVWNPPVRAALNQSWTRLLSRHEPDALVEHTMRYQSHALFIANGHVANGSATHQYKGLSALFEGLHAALVTARDAEPDVFERLTRRLVGIAATFYNMRGGDGGPGQLGYVTPGASELFEAAVMAYFEKTEAVAPGLEYELLLQLTLEAAANIPRTALQETLIRYSLEGPEKFRALASSSISDPKLVKLVAVSERLEPMYAQLERGAKEPPRRPQLSEPILKMFRRVRWVVPDVKEQRQDILRYLVPGLAEYRGLREIGELADASLREQALKEEESAWYLSSGLGGAIAENTDLHFDTMAEAVPQLFSNDAQARFWLPSVPWILSFKTALPEVALSPGALPAIDPYEELRSRAVRLFVSQLRPEADARNRKLAVSLANKTALRRSPEIFAALEPVLEFEEDKAVLKLAKQVLSTGRGKFRDDLAEAVSAEGGGAPVELAAEFVEDVTYFRDYVAPEMYRVQRTDLRSCIKCHGDVERTPMFLHPPDDVGYLAVPELLANYRTLQQRIDFRELQRSKLLRKPLNVQTGKEDGHQGGRRYAPTDPGYEILKRWVRHQVKNEGKWGATRSKVRKLRL